MPDSLDDKLARAFTAIEVKLDAIAKRVETHQLATERVERILNEIRLAVNSSKPPKT